VSKFLLHKHQIVVLLFVFILPQCFAQASGDSNSTQLPPTDQAGQAAIQKELDAMKLRIAQLEAELRAHTSTEHPGAVTAKATAPPAVVPPPASAAVPAEETVATAQVPAAKPAKAEPFAFADWTWLNGNPRTKDLPFDSKFFTPEIRADVAYTTISIIPKTIRSVGQVRFFVRMKST